MCSPKDERNSTAPPEMPRLDSPPRASRTAAQDPAWAPESAAEDHSKDEADTNRDANRLQRICHGCSLRYRSGRSEPSPKRHYKRFSRGRLQSSARFWAWPRISSYLAVAGFGRVLGGSGEVLAACLIDSLRVLFHGFPDSLGSFRCGVDRLLGVFGAAFEFLAGRGFLSVCLGHKPGWLRVNLAETPGRSKLLRNAYHWGSCPDPAYAKMGSAVTADDRVGAAVPAARAVGSRPPSPSVSLRMPTDPPSIRGLRREIYFRLLAARKTGIPTSPAGLPRDPPRGGQPHQRWLNLKAVRREDVISNT